MNTHDVIQQALLEDIPDYQGWVSILVTARGKYHSHRNVTDTIDQLTDTLADLWLRDTSVTQDLGNWFLTHLFTLMQNCIPFPTTFHVNNLDSGFYTKDRYIPISTVQHYKDLLECMEQDGA